MKPNAPAVATGRIFGSAGVVHWGIIGCGDVTEAKSGPGFRRAAGSRLEVVARRDAVKARDYAQRHEAPRWTSIIDEVLRDDKVDAIYIATPPGSHLEIARRVAAAGKPCYVEKPMARNFAESKAMADCFAEAGLPLFVAYYRRAYPRYQEVLDVLRSGELGELSGIRYELRRSQSEAKIPGRWRTDVAISGGGLFVDVGSHILDLLDFLLGPLRDVHGTAARAPDADASDPEDVVAAHFVAGRAAVGTATWNFRATDDAEILEITGARARLVLPDPMNGEECELVFADGAPGKRWRVPPPSPAVQLPLIQTVVDALLTGDVGVCPSTATSALRTAKYIDDILEGFYGCRQGQFWQNPADWRVNAAVFVQQAKRPRIEPHEIMA